jgi:hypothetical protein
MGGFSTGFSNQLSAMLPVKDFLASSGTCFKAHRDVLFQLPASYSPPAALFVTKWSPKTGCPACPKCSEMMPHSTDFPSPYWVGFQPPRVMNIIVSTLGRVIERVSFSFANDKTVSFGKKLHHGLELQVFTVNSSTSTHVPMEYVTKVFNYGTAIQFQTNKHRSSAIFGVVTGVRECQRAPPGHQVVGLKMTPSKEGSFPGPSGLWTMPHHNVPSHVPYFPLSAMAKFSSIMHSAMLTDYSSNGWNCDLCNKGGSNRGDARFFCRQCAVDICINCHGVETVPFVRVWSSQVAVDRVETLHFDGASVVTDHILKAVQNNIPPRLKSLDLICMKPRRIIMDSAAAQAFGSGVSLRGVQNMVIQCPNLTALDLSSSTSIFTPEGLAHICKSLPHLASLNISYNAVEIRSARTIGHGHHQASSLQTILPQCPRLTSLNAECSFPFEHETNSIDGIAENCPLLTELNINDAWHVSGLSFSNLTERLTNLLNLEIRGCHRIGDQGGLAILARNCTKLQRLCYGESVALDDDDVNFVDADARLISTSLPCLTSLTLRGCRGITDLGIKALSQQLTALRTLDLMWSLGREGVSAEGIYYLRTLATNLTSLDLGPGPIASSIIARFEQARPDCEVAHEWSDY